MAAINIQLFGHVLGHVGAACRAEVECRRAIRGGAVVDRDVRSDLPSARLTHATHDSAFAVGDDVIRRRLLPRAAAKYRRIQFPVTVQVNSHTSGGCETAQVTSRP